MKYIQPEMKPIIAREVPKVIQAMKQTTSRKVMLKLLTRIKVEFGIFSFFAAIAKVNPARSQRTLSYFEL